MRLNTAETEDGVNEIKQFVDWILHIGDGKMQKDYNCEAKTKIPQDLLILNNESPLLSIIQFVYPNNNSR